MTDLTDICSLDAPLDTFRSPLHYGDESGHRIADLSDLTVASTVNDLSLAGRCIPAGCRGEPVAGDFFDVFPLDASWVMIAVGDVAGHGLGAAAAMIRLQADTRRLALSTRSPAAVLSQLDRDSHRPIDEIATMWVGMYHQPTSRLHYSSAGHPPVVLVPPDAPPRLRAEASAPPLGTGVVGEHAVVETVHFRVGTLLVAYSDGLVERPDRDLAERIELLRATVGRACGDDHGHVGLVDVVQTILDELVPHTVAIDDMCLLVLRRRPRSI